MKGRDWYDLEWYIKKRVPLDLSHFLLRALDTDDWQEKSITKAQVLELIREKIQSVDFNSIKEDVIRFIQDDSSLSIWSPQYFTDLIESLKFKEG